MLEYLRNAAEKPLAKILIGILAFSFIGWGVAEWIFGGSMGDTTLVRVGGDKISVQQFSNQKSQELSSMSREQQRETYADPIALAQLNARVLNKITTQHMAEKRAADLGFVVTDARVAREIREFPEFQSNGRFSAFLFDNVLRASGFSEADFAAYLRAQILRSYVLGSMSLPMQVPQFAVRAAYNARYATRAIDYATVKLSDFTVGEPTEDQLRTFYASNPHVVPETRSVSYVLVPAEMSKPDSYDAAFTRAQHVEDDIISGESLEKAAAKNDAKYVAFDAFDADHRPVDPILTDAMIARVFHMDAGTESELLETKDGFVIMRVDKVVPSHNAEFENVKNNLVADWKRAEQKKQAYVRANELLVNLNQDGKLAGATSANVSRTSGAPMAVLVAAFNGGAANSIVPSDDAFYVLHVGDMVMPADDDKKMADVRKDLETMSAREITDDYNAFLIREYPVKINEKVYNRFVK